LLLFEPLKQINAATGAQLVINDRYVDPLSGHSRHGGSFIDAGGHGKTTPPESPLENLEELSVVVNQ
jgi:hypothetical protein